MRCERNIKAKLTQYCSVYKNKFNKINLLNIKNTPSNALSEQYWKLTPLVAALVALVDDVRLAESPDVILLDFLQSSDEASANLSGWDCSALERLPNYKSPASLLPTS